MTDKQVNKTTEVFESKNSNYSSTEVERALKLAEETLRDIIRVYKFETGTPVTALAAIREVLVEQDHIADAGKMIADHIAEADKMVGCVYCNNPLFAGTKCNNCGRVTLAEPVKQELNWGANKFMPHEQPVKQEPVDEQGRPMTYWGGMKDKPVKRPQNCGTGYCSCIECIYGEDGCVADEGQCNDGCLARESVIANAFKLADEIDAEFFQGRISNHSGRKAAQMLRMLVEAPVQPVKQESKG